MDPLTGIGRASNHLTAEPSAAASGRDKTASFAQVLSRSEPSGGVSTPDRTGATEQTDRATVGLRDRVESVMTDIFDDEKALNRAMRKAESGRSLSDEELLRLQGQMYEYAQKVDIATKVVDKTANGVKQLMQIQV